MQFTTVTCNINPIQQGDAVNKAYIRVESASKAGENVAILPFSKSPVGAATSFTIIVPRASTIYVHGTANKAIYEDSDGKLYNKIYPKALVIPDAATANLEDLLSIPVAPSEGITVVDENGDALPTLVGTFSVEGSDNVEVTQPSAGVALFNFTSLGGSANALDDLTDVTLTSPTNDDLLQRKAGVWVNRTVAQYKTDLALVKADVGLGNVLNSVQLVAANNLSDLANAGTARTNLGVAIGSDVAAFSHTHSIANVTGLQDALDLKASIVYVDNAVATLVDSSPATLDTLNELAAALGDDANFATTITTLIGTKQDGDADLTAIAALSPSNDDVIQRKAGAWTNRTLAQYKSDLSLNLVENTALSTWAGSSNLTTLGTIATGTWNATAIDYSKLSLTGSIVNADVSNSAAIAYSKLNLTGAILNADLAGSIALSKLSITGTPDGTKFLRDDGSWQAAGGGSGATTALDNLASVAINTDLLPTSTQSLGSATKPFLSSFVGNTTQYESVSQSAGWISHSALGSASNISVAIINKGSNTGLAIGGTSSTHPMLVPLAGGHLRLVNATFGAGMNFYAEGLFTPNETTPTARMNSSGVTLNSTGIYSWSSTGAATGAQDIAFGRNTAGMAEVNNGALGTFRDLKVRQYFADATMTAGGTTGNQTINKSAGSVNFAAGTSTLTVTNSLVTTNSIVICTVLTNDTTAQIKNCVTAAGSFTINLTGNTTAETKVGFWVLNA